jgi:hypothetical protein
MAMDTPVRARKDQLEAELDLDILRTNRRAIWAHWFAFLMMIAALLSSMIAGLGGLSSVLPKLLIGFLALLPGVFAVAAIQFKPQERSSYHYRKVNALNSLRSRLLYQQPAEPTLDQIAAVARERDSEMKRLQEEWDRGFQLNWAGFLPPSTQSPVHKS